MVGQKKHFAPIRFAVLLFALAKDAVADVAGDNGPRYTRPRVAVCFYGPSPGMLAFTRSSVWSHVLDVLEYNGWQADVYLHSYGVQRHKSPQTIPMCSGKHQIQRARPMSRWLSNLHGFY